MIRHFHFETLSSTQDEIFRLFEKKEVSPFLVTTDEQTSGRGRMGRIWNSEKGRSLTMSLGVKLPAAKILGLSLAVGLGVREALSEESLQLKWPNDLMMNNEKVGGILIESKSHGDLAEIAIGVGVNLFDQQSVSFKGIKKQISSEFVAEKILNRLEPFSQKGFIYFKSEYEKYMWNRGKEIRLKIQDEEKLVLAVGVSEKGYLITRDGEELAMTDQGEILWS
ncbi:MAG: biotin--[acetyl-CoA-carboxylase] ligase [Deltaproteobacteria bacterium]|nr:biotin--[acetyl-CoA-carboxylase] ligase [Deltaproteobacteria bacterium]